ncbi:hypothetical protein Hanom_Chr14g01286931 [Helianthus anomalus]
MPQMTEQDGGYDDVEVPPQHEQGDHRHPQRAYRVVRLSRSTNRLLDRILRNQDEQMRLLTLHGQEITSHGFQMDQMHDDIGWLMTGMSEMYKYMGISVPPRPPSRVYPDQGPFFMQQPDPSMPSFTQPLPSMQARPIHGTARHPLLGVARTLQRRSSLSLTRSLTSIDDDDSGFYYHIM